ncbi:MAG: hypothetical protein RLW62_21635 [Gammaproteobacteria bacterium]
MRPRGNDDGRTTCQAGMAAQQSPGASREIEQEQRALQRLRRLGEHAALRAAALQQYLSSSQQCRARVVHVGWEK